MPKLKILIIDEITKQVEEFSSVLDNLTPFDIHKTTQFEDCIKYYDNNKYEFVIMDHSCKDSDKLLDYILTKNGKQKFILLSDSLNCPIDCSFCLNTFEFVRLLKPIKIIEVFKYIQNKMEFSCPNQYKLNNLDSIEKLFELINIEEYSFYKYKEIIDECLYFKPENDSNVNIEELNKIQNFTNNDYFETKVMGDFSIKVEKKI